MSEHVGLPVAGYQSQSSARVDLVNANKAMEECVLRLLDALEADPETDKSWLLEGRRRIENGFMSVNRAVFRPTRVKLPGDA